MSSNAKGKKHNKGKKDTAERRRAAAAGAVSSPPVDALVDEMAAQAQRLRSLEAAVRELADSEAQGAQQLRRVLAAQRRTNSLLELSLASAFDLELEG